MSQRVGAESVFERFVSIIEAVRASAQGLSRGQIASAVGLPKATTNRIVAQLVDERVLRPVDGRLQLGIRLFEWGAVAEQQGFGLRDASLPYIEDLYEITHQTVQIAVLDGTEVVYLQKLSGQRSARLNTRVGGRMPATCTGSGKALLAFSPQSLLEQVLAAHGLVARTIRSITDERRLRDELVRVRRQQFAVDDQEFQLGMTSVAAPIFEDARVVAAIALSGPSERMSVDNAAIAVRTTAASITRELARMRGGAYPHLGTDPLGEPGRKEPASVV